MPINFVACAVAANSVNTCWGAYLNLRQMRATHTPLSSLPPAMQSLTTEADFAKAQVYTRDRCRLSITRGLFSGLLIDNAMFASGAMGRVWDAVGRLSFITRGGFAHSWLWGASFDVIETLLSVPWDYYSTFVVEQRHGFNKTTIGTFIADRVKMLLLNVGLIRPITTWVLRWVVSRFGASFPLYLCGAASVITIAATFIVPTLIMPLFNKFETLQAGETRERIEALAQRINFPLTKLYVMDGSKRSAHSNAFFYGFWKNKRIVLFDVLLEQMSPAEIEAVLAHELGHWHHSHMVKNLVQALVQLFAMGTGASKTMFNPELYEAFGMPRGATDPVMGFELFNAVYWQPVSEVINVGRTLITRRYEFQADAFAAELGYSAELRSGLVKMFKENSATLTPDPVYAAVRYSHPPLRERLAGLEAVEKKAT